MKAGFLRTVGSSRRRGGARQRMMTAGIAGALLVAATGADAQIFGERPPPVPPTTVPNVLTGPAINLAPPSGPAAQPDLPPAQPSLATPAPIAPAAPLVPSGQAVLALNARFGKDMPAVNGGLIWRVYADRPDASGAFKLIKEDRGATPNIVLQPGTYIVHASLGLVSSVRTVIVKQETLRETFELPAGGLRIEGRVGGSKIPQGQITFDVYKGSQFETAERAPIVQAAAATDIVLLPEGIYYIISNYGDANSVVRSDIRVHAGKLTDVTVQHRAAAITFKLVGDKGGEALANTSWTVITPAGDVIKEATGAFPRVVLAEGEYRAIARNEGKVFERGFKVLNGVDGEIEVVAQ